MHFILLAALSSVVVAIILKSANKRGIDLVQLIGWSYVSALGLAFLLLMPQKIPVNTSEEHAPLLALLGLMLPLVFLFYSQSLKTAGLIRSEIAQRLSLLIGLSAAYFLFDDTFTPLKATAIVIGVAAMLIILLQKSGSTTTSTSHASYWLLLTWLGYGVIDITLKMISSTGIPLGITLVYAFSIALVVMTGVIAYRRMWQGHAVNAQAAAVGLVMGAFNVANISFYVKAHQTLADQPAIVFAGMNILVVALGVVAGRAIYKESLSTITLIALSGSMMAIALLAMTQWR